MTADHAYGGRDLDLFSQATNWKAYWAGVITPMVGDRVLDVGAGLGGTIQVLGGAPGRSWVALEPAENIASRLRQAQAAGQLGPDVEVRHGTVATLPASERFDTILYIDVLEHIEDDRAEVAHAAQHLTSGGHLIVLAPAHNALFTQFDATIGHYRRYSRRTLLDLQPPGLTVARSIYLDAVGLLASLGNKLVLKASMPTAAQIALWDKHMVPLSRRLDPLMRHTLGKTVIAAWKKP